MTEKDLDLPDPKKRLSQEEQKRLREALDEWLIDSEKVAPHVAS